MAAGKWLRLDRNYLSKPEFSELLRQPDGLSNALIYCNIIIAVGEVVPCDKQKLAQRIRSEPEKVQRALNAFYKAGFIRLTDKDPMAPPTLEEIAEYCREIGSSVDPVRFYDCYAANEFTWKGAPMDWKAKLRQWNVREKPRRYNTALPGSESPVSQKDLLDFMSSRNMP